MRRTKSTSDSDHAAKCELKNSLHCLRWVVRDSMHCFTWFMNCSCAAFAGVNLWWISLHFCCCCMTLFSLARRFSSFSQCSLLEVQGSTELVENAFCFTVCNFRWIQLCWFGYSLDSSYGGSFWTFLLLIHLIEVWMRCRRRGSSTSGRTTRALFDFVYICWEWNIGTMTVESLSFWV